jgi:hypothetical protein
MKSLLIAAAFATLLSAPAAASAFKVGDLGAMPSRRACMETAAKVLEAYVAEHGGLSTSGDPDEPQSWSFYGWGLRPGTTDAVITCPIVGNQVNAFYTLHSAGDEGEGAADIAGARIRALWQKLR